MPCVSSGKAQSLESVLRWLFRTELVLDQADALQVFTLDN